MTQYMN